MSDSIYAPPEADVSVDVADEPDFYVVAPRKFYLLAVLTFNLYFVYWFYRNWRRIKERNNEDIWPPARAIFYIFFTHALFKNIDLKIKLLGKTFSWNPGMTATLFVVLSIVSNVRGVGLAVEYLQHDIFRIDLQFRLEVVSSCTVKSDRRNRHQTCAAKALAVC